MLKLVTIAAIFGLALGADVSIKYPSKNSCVLVDIDASFEMVWTDANGAVQTIPDFPFAVNAVLTGSCSPISQVSVRLNGGETFAFAITQKNDTVQYDWEFRYSPQDVFNNSQPVAVSHTGTLGTGPATKSFACQSLPVVDSTKSGADSNKYQVKITINSFKAQGFNVNGGQYSPEGRCASDETTTPSNVETTEPTTETTPTIKTTQTTEPTTETTKLTTETTKPTTETTPTTAPSTKPTPGNETTAPTTGSTPGNETTAPSTQTTAPSTTPIPPPNGHAKQTFAVYDEGVQCVRMTGEFLLTLAYTKEDNTTGTQDIGVQEIRSVAGNCNNTNGENVVTVFFYDTWRMDLTISKPKSAMLAADDSSKYYWSNLVLKYDYATKLGGKLLFPNVKPSNKTAQVLNATFDSGTYEASTGGSYVCNSNEALDLKNNNKLQTWNLQYEAFTSTNSTSFSDKNLTECSADSKTSSVVPIAVGAALAGLVVIVLIAYLIGRRRNRKGYESV